MYRNLEEDRKNGIQAADASAKVDCTCVCKVPTEEAKAAEPAGDQSVTDLQVHWKRNGGEPSS